MKFRPPLALLWVALALASSLPAGQGDGATQISGAVQAPFPEFQAEPITVVAKRLSPTAGLPETLKKELNAPLQPTPTATEKKIAPIVKTANAIWVLYVFSALIAGFIQSRR